MTRNDATAERAEPDTVAEDGEVVTLAHGAGGEAMRELVDKLAVSRFGDATSDATEAAKPGAVGLPDLDDGSAHPLAMGDASIVLTTDSHVVSPPVFPGGDIGRLSVAGTVNDLAVMGATEPLALTCSLVVEAGTPTAELEEILESMREACEDAGVAITTGDTKVMGNGELDGPVINTTGIGAIDPEAVVTDAGLSPGDAIVVSGTVGDHGIALLSEREGFDFGGELESDVAPVNDLVAAAVDAGRVTAMKDPTRGGLATTLNEMAEKAAAGIEIEERAIPVDDAIASAGEVLGIDPLSVANEGKVVLGVDPADDEAVLEAIRSHPLGSDAAIVGRATEENTGRVVLDTGFGRRYLSEPAGEALPRIC
ncbi:hydrogenase expression/formation protein HypE [Halorubrum luteum]